MNVFNFKTNNNKIKVASASILSLSLFLSGCGLSNYVDNTKISQDSQIVLSNNTEVVSSDSLSESQESGISESIPSDSTTKTEESHTTESASIVSEDNIIVSIDERKDFLNNYFDQIGLEPNTNLEERSFGYQTYMFGEEMRSAFVKYYNDNHDDQLESISRVKMIEMFNDLVLEKTSKSGFMYQSDDTVFYTYIDQIFYRNDAIPFNHVTDEVINSYLAINNLPMGHIFTYEEIKAYMPDLSITDGYAYVGDEYMQYSGNFQNMPACMYMAAMMMWHNYDLNTFTSCTWIDTETLQGEFSNEFADKIDEKVSQEITNYTGVPVLVSYAEPLTPEKFEEIYGYAPLDVSPETLQELTVKEAKGSNQR